MVLLKNESHVLPFNKEKTDKIVVLGVLGDTENIGDHGSSKVHPYYTVTPLRGLMKKMPAAQVLYDDGSNLEKARSLAAEADAVVIVAGYIHSDEGEFLADRSDIADMGGDRSSMRLHQRDIDLIKGMKGVNKNTVVSLVGSSAILIDEWVDDVPAIVFSFYSGMEGGSVLADILFGDVCPSGKLPYTVTMSEDSYPAFDPNCTYVEYEYYHGYCKMEKEQLPVLYPFGYGLSYTTFKIDKPEVQVFDKIAKLAIRVKNTGNAKGAEVIQLYVGCEGSVVDRPVKVLKDFVRIELKPGEEKEVYLTVSQKDMAYFNEEKDDFIEEDIPYIAYVGNCSASEMHLVRFEF
jgi:beta-glucosidase